MIFKRKYQYPKGLFLKVSEDLKVQQKLKNQPRNHLDLRLSHLGLLDLDSGVPNPRLSDKPKQPQNKDLVLAVGNQDLQGLVLKINKHSVDLDKDFLNPKKQQMENL